MPPARSARPSSTPVSTALARLVAAGTLTPDPLQIAAAQHLDRIATALRRKPKWPQALLGAPEPVRGAYLFGDVGRGKTMLMDLFFAEAGITEKRRLHFHEFMDEVHGDIASFRAATRGRKDNADPIAAVTRPILDSVRLLCLDEFQVSDITNAMLLGRLFEKLFAGGLTLVATSNVMPDQLYAEGLNRELFLPFITLLKEHADLVPLDGGTDYRRLKFEGQQVYRFGSEAETRPAMDRLWLRLTGGIAGAPCDIESLGRQIRVPRAAMGAARFGFAELCETPLGARDYLKLAHAFDTLMIENVPPFDRTRTDAARRFIALIDTLYDRGIKLAASFAVPLDQLSQNERTKAEFARTISRLIEMQSAEYLGAARKGERAAAEAPGPRGSTSSP